MGCSSNFKCASSIHSKNSSKVKTASKFSSSIPSIFLDKHGPKKTTLVSFPYFCFNNLLWHATGETTGIKKGKISG